MHFQVENDESSNTREKYKLNVKIPKSNQVRFGTKSLRCLGSKVWNSLPYHIKSSENLSIFKTLKKNWNGTVCSCKKGKLLINVGHILHLSSMPSVFVLLMWKQVIL